MNAVIHPVAIAQVPAPVTVAPEISITPLLAVQIEIASFNINAEDVEGQCERAEITSIQSYQAGSDLLTSINAQLKLAEALRVRLKKPADDYGKLIQQLFKPLEERFTAAKSALNAKMLRWHNAEEARQRAAQEAIRKQQQEEADRLAAQARAQGNEKTAEAIETMVAAAPKAPTPKIGAPNVYGRTTQKRVYWNGSSHDPMEILRQVLAGALPAHLVEFSPSAMNAEAKKYIESLPESERKDRIHLGIKITKEEKLV